MRRRVIDGVNNLLLALLTFIGMPPMAHGQQAELLTLKQERITYEPQGYYIDKIIDDRRQTTNIGTTKKGIPIIINPGAAPALMQFLEKNVKQNKDRIPLALHITKLNIRIRQSGRAWHTETEALFTFYYGDMPLTTPMGSTGQAESPDYSLKYGEELLRKSLGNVLKSFDKWWIENKDRVPLTNTVTLNVAIARNCDREGLIAYTFDHPLRIADFKASGIPKKQKGMLPADIAACTSSTIEKKARMEVRESRHVIDIILTPAFDMHESWFKPGVTDERVLAHEQTHFDITALKTCELVNVLKLLKLTADNYEATLNELFKKFDAEWTAEQDQYDQETDHGLIADKQISWEQKISKKLKEEGCYQP